MDNSSRPSDTLPSSPNEGSFIDADSLRESAGEAGCLAVLRSLGIDTEAGSRSGDNLSGLRLPPSIDADRNPSLSVHLTKWTWNDFGSDLQGNVYQLVQEDTGDTFPEAVERVARITGCRPRNGSVQNGTPPPSLTLQTLAEQKRLPVGLFKAERWRQSGRYVRIAYFEADGTEARPQLRGSDGGQFWGTLGEEASRPIVPIGLHRLGEALGNTGDLALVEGATDWITLRHHGLPALGIPGANMTAKLEAEHLAGVNRVFVVKEDDAGGGATFARNATARLQEIGFEGKVLVVEMARSGFKDPSALHIDDQNRFLERWNGLLSSSAAFAEEDLLTAVHDERGPAPAIPERAFRLLPPSLAEACEYFAAWYERDVFLTALLGVLSALAPNVRFQYGETPKYYSLHLMFFLLARAAGGKGAAEFAFRWASEVDKKLEQDSEEDRAAWALRRDEYERAKRSKVAAAEPPGPEPEPLFVEAADDTTLGSLYDALAANHDDGVGIFTTEGDGLSGANKKEHGGFSYLIRKAFHHERAIEGRRGTGRRKAEHPRLAIVATGTEDQFRRMLDSVEDGMYSRFGVYAFEAPLDYRSQRPRPGSRDVVDFTEKKSQHALALWATLRNRRFPSDEAKARTLFFDVPPHLWDRIDNAFDNLNTALFAQPGVSPYLSATVRRGALIAFRIAGVLALWRAYDRGDDLANAQHIQASDEDVEAAILLATTYAEHALMQAADLGGARAAEAGADSAHRMSGQQRAFLDALPEVFGRTEMLVAAEAVGAHQSTAYRWVRVWVEEAGLLQKDAQGVYRKTMPAKPANSANSAKNPATATEAQVSFSHGSGEDAETEMPYPASLGGISQVSQVPQVSPGDGAQDPLPAASWGNVEDLDTDPESTPAPEEPPF
jgi:hypothetical protein